MVRRKKVSFWAVKPKKTKVSFTAGRRRVTFYAEKPRKTKVTFYTKRRRRR